MRTMRGKPRQAFAALACLVGVAFLSSVRAADDPALRKRALALNQVTGAGAVKGEIRALTEDPAGTRKLLAVATRMAKEKPQPFAFNATIILASAAEKLKDTEAGETFYRLHAEQALKLLSAEGLTHAYCGLDKEEYGGLILMLLKNKKYAECEKACREFLGLEVEGDETAERLKPRVLRELITALAKKGDTKEALNILDRLITAQPDNWLTLEMKGEVLREAGRTAEALKVYEQVIALIEKDKRLKKEDKEEYANGMRYLLSGLYVDLNQIDKAAEELKALLAKEPDNPSYNNDLGYIWADRGMNLEESERMIRKAIEEDRKLRKKDKLAAGEDRDSAAYLDSLGWVLYKQKKYKEAKPYLLDAVKDKGGRHIEIYDHLGDVHLALGEKAEALKAWKEGAKLAGPSPREQKRKAEVEKKIKANE
jgi:tetratricopeptide (TPR) repeat protein